MIKNAQSQVQATSDQFRLSNHRFLNSIAKGISAMIAESVPGLKLQYIGKSINGDKISAVLTGEVILEDKDKLDSAVDKVNTTIQGLKNPANLLAAMKE